MKQCKICGNPDISLFWSGSWGERFYCSFSCSCKGFRYTSLLIAVVYFLVMFQPLQDSIDLYLRGFEPASTLIIIILFIQLIIISYSFWGFIVKIEPIDRK